MYAPQHKEVGFPLQRHSPCSCPSVLCARGVNDCPYCSRPSLLLGLFASSPLQLILGFLTGVRKYFIIQFLSFNPKKLIAACLKTQVNVHMVSAFKCMHAFVCPQQILEGTPTVCRGQKGTAFRKCLMCKLACSCDFTF